MSSCDFDHPVKDVENKLADQKQFLPEDLFKRSSQLLKEIPDQETLNELFHLLKKYDLASDEAKVERNNKLQELITANQ